jgi:hypothetical protein
MLDKIQIALFVCAALLVACEAPVNGNVSDVSHEVVPLNEETFRVDVANPNHVRVGSRFNVRIYWYDDGRNPEQRLEHAYIGPRNSGSLTVHTGGCEAAPEWIPESESAADDVPTCDIRVTATLLETYFLATQ